MTKNIFGLFQYGFMRLYYPIVKYFLRLKVVGAENLRDVPPGAVFIANHLSKLDPFLIGAAVTRDYHKKIAAFRYPTFPTYMRQWYSLFIWLFGAYTIQPKSGDLPQVLARTIDILRAGQESVLIFPAGKINRYVDKDDARPGIGHVVSELDPVIVPVFIKNTYNIKLIPFLARLRDVSVIIGKPFKISEIDGMKEADNLSKARLIMAKSLELVKFPPSDKIKTYGDVPGYQKALESDDAKQFMQLLPDEVRREFTNGYLEKKYSKTFHDHLLKYSHVAQLINRFPGSSEAFEYLYLEKNAIHPLDEYYQRCCAGAQIYKRLIALDNELPKWTRQISGGKKIKIDSFFSGPSRDLIRVLRSNPDLKGFVDIRNIDIDKNAVEIGVGLVKEFGLEEVMKFECRSFEKAKPRNTDLILLIGVLCPMELHRSERLLSFMKRYAQKGAYVIYSTAQHAMIDDDPLTDYMMRTVGWSMAYKSDQEAWDLAIESGWEPITQFYDQPRHHHCMTVARLK